MIYFYNKLRFIMHFLKHKSTIHIYGKSSRVRDLKYPLSRRHISQIKVDVAGWEDPQGKTTNF